MYLHRPDFKQFKNHKLNITNTRRFYSYWVSPVFKEEEFKLPNDLLKGIGKIPEKTPNILNPPPRSNNFEIKSNDKILDLKTNKASIY